MTSLTVSNSLTVDPGYVRIQRQNKRLKARTNQLELLTRISVIFSMIILLACIVIGGYCVNKVRTLQDTIVELQTENQRLLEENQNLSKSFNIISDDYKKISEIAVTLDNDNQKLISQCNSYQKDLEVFKEREELYNKYDYALVRNNNRTDIKYDDIKMLQELAKEKGMREESVDLILSIVMTESEGKEKASNPNSTAIGFGQFLSGTGKFVYTELMGNSTYNHSEIAANGTENLRMMCYYIKYLDDKYNGNIDKVINEYRGLSSPEYKSKIDQYLKNNNLSLATIKLN